MDSVNVGEIFRSLLLNPSASSSHQYLSPSTTPEPLLAQPPAKHSLRFIENDPKKRREKYDGCRWRAVCFWNVDQCTNLAGFSDDLCYKHHAFKLNKPPRQRNRKQLLSRASLPISKADCVDFQTKKLFSFVS